MFTYLQTNHEILVKILKNTLLAVKVTDSIVGWNRFLMFTVKKFRYHEKLNLI